MPSNDYPGSGGFPGGTPHPSPPDLRRPVSFQLKHNLRAPIWNLERTKTTDGFSAWSGLMKAGVEQLRHSRRASEERTRLHRIGETLRKRLALSLKMDTPSDKLGINVVAGSHTDQFNRILVLWLDLNRAVTEARFANQSERESSLVPWSCEVPEINRLGEQITRPENLAVLLEGLGQSTSGEAEIWAQQALQECQLRGEGNDLNQSRSIRPTFEGDTEANNLSEQRALVPDDISDQ